VRAEVVPVKDARANAAVARGTWRTVAADVVVSQREARNAVKAGIGLARAVVDANEAVARRAVGARAALGRELVIVRGKAVDAGVTGVRGAGVDGGNVAAQASAVNAVARLVGRAVTAKVGVGTSGTRYACRNLIVDHLQNYL
jgi:hypothetical protein